MQHGAEGAARSLGHKLHDTISYTLSGVESVEETTCDKSGGENCSQDSCRRKTKRGCPRRMCQRCCFASKKSQDLSSSEDTDVQAEVIFCPVHRDKGQTNKQQSMPSNVSCGRGNTTVVGKIGAASPEITSYTSNCKVVLVGLGADEQMAGYGRHRTVFMSGGVDALVMIIFLSYFSPILLFA